MTGIAVPSKTGQDAARILNALDPTLTHLAKQAPPRDNQTRLVSDGDPMAEDMALLQAEAVWTTSGMPASSLASPQGTAPMGSLTLTFVDSADEGPSQDAVCETLGAPHDAMDPISIGSGGWRDGAQFTPCTESTLPDGSVLMTRTRSHGPLFTATVIRQFPGDAGAMAVTWENYAPVQIPSSTTPDPKRALVPNPITLEKLKATMSDSGLVPPLAPVPVSPPPATALQASDFGPGWTFDPMSSHGLTGDLVVDDGCVNEQNPVASPQRIYGYTGKTPSGISVTASAMVDVMAPGTGPKWMTDLRQHGTGGCDPAGLPYSKDTMTSLPAGTGDDAFIENWYGLGSETFFVRFGDQILRVDVKTTDQKMPAFTQADKDWFAGLAAKAAARQAGKG